MTHKSSSEVLTEVSIDCIIFGFEDGKLKLLLVQRNIEPESGKWAIPGGFVYKNESIGNSAKRILEELTGVKNIYLEQLSAFGDVDRYPERVITITYYSLIKPGNYKLNVGIDAKDAKWCELDSIPNLVFDHQLILNTALAKLKRKIRYEPIGFELLPGKFTLHQIQELYEAIHNQKFDKPNFRRKILNMDLLDQLKETQTGKAHRAPRLYSFDKVKYDKLKEKGFNFEL
jgi:8-oxo-dGTP diphosphatase